MNDPTVIDEADETVPDDDESESEGESAGPSSPQKIQVFISYRTDPDEQTAIALRRLLESSLHPPVSVFVAGAGGLKPDNIGLNPQLQQAVQEARAFVAILTPASKDREWVIFEAGAAWGRSQLYAPLLIDTKPEDLGTTIGHYVATPADNREKVETLIRSVASALGVSLKTHFGKRYSAFQRHLEQRAEGLSRQPEPHRQDGSLVNHAIQLWFKGQREDAEQAFEAAFSSITNVEELANARIVRLSLGMESRASFLKTLESLDESIKATAAYQSWRATYEARPDKAVEFLRSVYSNANALPHQREQALRDLCEKLALLGRKADVTRMLLAELRQASLEHRPRLAESLLLHGEPISPIGKLAIIAASVGGTAHSASALLGQLSNLALDEHWPSLAVFAARYTRELMDDGTSRNNLGRAYFAAGLFSHAYEAYQTAISSGVGVATTNVAAMLGHTAIPAAGLALLRAHQGDSDAARSAFPFKVRANLEELVDNERTQANALVARAESLFWQIATLAERALANGQPKSSEPCEVSAPDGRRLTLNNLAPLDGLWVAMQGPMLVGLFVAKGDDYDGLLFDLRDLSHAGQAMVLRRSQPSPNDEQSPAFAHPIEAEQSSSN